MPLPISGPLAATVLLLAQSAVSTQADVDLQSLMTTPVILANGRRDVSQGTGFFFASTKADGVTADTAFLVTNYHVVTGHGPQVQAPPAGDRIRFALHADINDLERIRIVELPLYDQHGLPVWVASETHPTADVVLVPLPTEILKDIPPLWVFTEAHAKADIRIRPTSGATLLGYPYGFYDTKHSLPIWKTGHVASEPNVDFEGRPVFLVDVSAFPGMSGSPVLAVATGIYESEDGVMKSGRVLKLLGIFSAMPVVHERKVDPTGAVVETPMDTSLQLGYVWKAALIADMARSYRK